MKSLFPTIVAVLFGLAFEEFYAETAMPREDLWRILTAVPLCIVPIVFVEAMLLRARKSLAAGKALDTQKFAKYVASAPLPLYLAILFVSRWPTILVQLGLESAVFADHLVVLAPFFVLHAICVIESTRLRRPLQMRDGSIRAARVRDVMPVLLEQGRHVGMLLLPLFVLILLLDLVSDTSLRLYFRRIPLLAFGFLIVLFALLTLVFPEVFRVTMNLKPLVAGAPLRIRLDELSKRLGFRCRHVLYWPTSRPVFNALIVGILPRFRYVVLTEELCKRLTLDEICAVYAHEVGHGKRAHALFYVLLSVTFLALLLPFGEWVGQEIAFMTSGRIDAMLATTLFAYLPAFAIYWKVALDTLSKRFELESDVFGLEASRDPALFITTLEKVARLARLERRKAAMRHFSIEGRVDFLRRAFLDGDHALLARFRQQIARIRKTILCGAAIALTGTAIWIGFQSLHGYGSVLLEHGEYDRSARWMEGLLRVRSSDAIAATLLSEAELYRGLDSDAGPQRWRSVFERIDEIRPSTLSRIVEELRGGWTRGVLHGRLDVATAMLDRLDAILARANGGSMLGDPNLSEQMAAFRFTTRALERSDGAEIGRILEANPRWLRRPDARDLEAYLGKWAADHK